MTPRDRFTRDLDMLIVEYQAYTIQKIIGKNLRDYEEGFFDLKERFLEKWSPKDDD